MGQDNPFNVIEMGNEAKTVDRSSKKKVVRLGKYHQERKSVGIFGVEI